MNKGSTAKKHLKPPQVLQSLPKSENLNFLSNNAFLEFPSLSRWVLTPVKLPYSRTRKMNLFKMFGLQRILVSRKRP